MSDTVFKCLGATNHKVEGEREKNDFYATPNIGTENLLNMLNKHNVVLPKTIIDPGVGAGGIANVLKENDYNVIGYDIVDRGFPNVILQDYLTISRPEIEEIGIIGNFPYKNILEFTYKSLSLLKEGEILCSLSRIQFLESEKRRRLFDEQPPKFVFVFSKRINCHLGGIERPVSSAICYCWVVWEKGFKGYPIIDWI